MVPQMDGKSRMHVDRDGHYKCLGLGVVSVSPHAPQPYSISSEEETSSKSESPTLFVADSLRNFGPSHSMAF